MSSLDKTTRRDERVSEIIAWYLDAREGRTAQTPEEILAQYPEFEKELREFFENEEFVRNLLSGNGSPPTFGDDYER